MAPLLDGQTIALSGSHPDYKQGKQKMSRRREALIDVFCSGPQFDDQAERWECGCKGH